MAVQEPPAAAPCPFVLCNCILRPEEEPPKIEKQPAPGGGLCKAIPILRPPDANHGFYVGSASVTARLPDNKNVTMLAPEVNR